MLKPIPESVKKILRRDPFMKRCCVCGRSDGKIDWHHNFQSYENGRKGRVSEAWCLLPLCPLCHEHARTRDVREKLDWIMLGRATEEDLKPYPRGGLQQRKKYVESLFGPYTQGKILSVVL